MVSKKRTGNIEGASPGGFARSSGGAIRAVAEVGMDGKGVEVPGRYRGSTEAYLAGRRGLAYELVSMGGLNSSRLGLEILYLLPDDFVEFYENLFHRALSVRDDSVMHGRSGGVEKASGRVGMQLGTADRGGQASGSGKKWKNTPMAIGNEQALRVKQAVDKGLEDLVRLGKRGLIAEAEAGRRDREGERESGGQGPGDFSKVKPSEKKRGVPGSTGNTRATGNSGRGSTGYRCAGSKCGRFLKAGWNWCPECGTRVG